MKTFQELLPGDKIYYILNARTFTKVSDKYGNSYHDGINFHQSDITDIFNSTDLSLNGRYNNYHGKTIYDLIIPKDFKGSSVYKTEDKIFFTDESLRDSVMKEMVLNEIEKIEKEKINFILSSNNTVNEIRKNYFSILNSI